jgi:hypothetical protein
MSDQADPTKAGRPGILGRTLPGTGGDLAPDVEGHGLREIPPLDKEAGPREKRVPPPDEEADVEGHRFRRPSEGGEYTPDGLIRRAPDGSPRGEG